MDVFITHTAADPDPHLHNYTNEYYRKAQVKELMTTYVNGSKADVVLLGGDFNAGPIKKEGTVISGYIDTLAVCHNNYCHSLKSSQYIVVYVINTGIGWSRTWVGLTVVCMFRHLA